MAFLFIIVFDKTYLTIPNSLASWHWPLTYFCKINFCCLLDTRFSCLIIFFLKWHFYKKHHFQLNGIDLLQKNLTLSYNFWHRTFTLSMCHIFSCISLSYNFWTVGHKAFKFSMCHLFSCSNFLNIDLWPTFVKIFNCQLTVALWTYIDDIWHTYIFVLQSPF